MSQVESMLDYLKRWQEAHRGSFFEHHRCWRCNHGEKACVQGNSHNCEYPRALND
jgi:hypothetical protein